MTERKKRLQNLPHDRRTDDEERARQTAQRLRKSVTFIADDGCEVTVTPQGHFFYNAADLWLSVRAASDRTTQD